MRKYVQAIAWLLLSGWLFVARGQVQRVESGGNTLSVTDPTGPTTKIDVSVPLKLSGALDPVSVLPGAASPRAVVEATNSGRFSGLYGESTNGTGVVGRGASSGVSGSSANGIGVTGRIDPATGRRGGVGVYGESTLDSGIGVRGVGGSSAGRGVEGTNTAGGVGVWGSSERSIGVYGETNSDSSFGVEGFARTGFGVAGESNNVGVFAHNTTPFFNNRNDVYLATRDNAGDFHGDVSIQGKLSKSAGGFKIDHPLDPARKYLHHSFVESPDMMDIYNGNARVDSHGEAVIELPSWFEALNREFRYQLTSIGAPSPNLYVAEEIAGNRFKIAGGRPGSKVSWQVTGIRHDAYANAHRIPVEEEKPALELGFYIHPELYGERADRSVEFARHPQIMQRNHERGKELARR
jgi:hypothetical protein